MMTNEGSLLRYTGAARWVLVSVGAVFLLNGLTVIALAFSGMVPRTYHWIGVAFLLLGSVGALTAYFGLRSFRPWAPVVLGLLYLPWTVFGLVGDTRQGYWALVAGEVMGLVLVTLALVVRLGPCLRRR